MEKVWAVSIGGCFKFEQIHRINDECAVRRMFSCRVRKLLDRFDGVFLKNLFSG